MEKYKLIARSRIGDLVPRGNKFSQRKWGSFAKDLNELGPCKKSGKGWKKYWTQCRLNARTKEAKFLKAYGKTGNSTICEELDPDVDRICKIFGSPGLGFAIIPECGFKPRKLMPTQDQMETMCYYLLNEPEFGIELTEQLLGDDLLNQLHSRVGPTFSQSEWKDFWFAAVGNMKMQLARVGPNALDEFNTLVHEVFATCQEYVDQFNEGLSGEEGDSYDNEDMEEESEDGDGLEFDKREDCSRKISIEDGNSLEDFQRKTQSKVPDEVSGRGGEMGKGNHLEQLCSRVES
ncbi:hypothetical protein QAD02_018444 [Eretmocerus hayati]|uniref:Uncharacterized protein n=1 Tax=Eretmocerus hayati TaxID=131215 RepID=A0ACC2PGQ1_9HYME|nr:hypothetical protein QAD02_018444 [Eretmocerus hayati]